MTGPQELYIEVLDYADGDYEAQTIPTGVVLPARIGSSDDFLTVVTVSYEGVDHMLVRAHVVLENDPPQFRFLTPLELLATALDSQVESVNDEALRENTQ